MASTECNYEPRPLNACSRRCNRHIKSIHTVCVAPPPHPSHSVQRFISSERQRSKEEIKSRRRARKNTCEEKQQAMPNTGMLDHRMYRRTVPRSRVHWMESWPPSSGYSTVSSARVAGFSRHMHLMTNSLSWQSSMPPSSRPPSSRLDTGNSISPFHTAMKPTCGYFFSRDTENRKCRIGIPPSDLVAWRSQTRRVQSAH